MFKFKLKIVKSLSMILLAAVLLIFPAINSSFSSTGIQVNDIQNDTFVKKIHPLVLQALLTEPNKNIQVIVAKKPNSNVENKMDELGTIIAKWDFINAFAIEINPSDITRLAKMNDIKFIVLNQKTKQAKKDDKSKSSVDSNNIASAYPYAVKADKVWEKGYDGTGVTVAVVDSGISKSSGKNDFNDRLITSVKFNSTTNNSSDSFGHGSHVAGIIGGNGQESNGKYVGIAPGVNLINVKFSDDQGAASEADLVNALQWIYDNKDTYNIRVVNISSNVGVMQSYLESAIAAAVEQLWFGGVVVVVSTGNRGGEFCSTCYAPANDPFVISVGAVDDNGTVSIEDDYMKAWSSSGKTLDGHYKPDIVAPGANIVSYMPSGILRKIAPENIVDDKYFKMGGTSMAAPIVTGIVALMLQVNPDLTPDQVKWIIQNSTRPYNNQPYGSPGIIKADKAVFYDVSLGVPSANQGLILRSPFLHSSDLTIMYGNMSWSNMSWSNMSWSNSHKY